MKSLSSCAPTHQCGGRRREQDAGSTTGEIARKYQLSPHLLDRWRGEWRAKGEKPAQNGYVESFQGKLRDEFLNVSWFLNLFDGPARFTSLACRPGKASAHAAPAHRRAESK
jgi:hypothetical protein